MFSPQNGYTLVAGMRPLAESLAVFDFGTEATKFKNYITSAHAPLQHAGCTHFVDQTNTNLLLMFLISLEAQLNDKPKCLGH